MKPPKTGKSIRIFVVGVFLYLHYSAVSLWFSLRLDDTFLFSLLFFHTAIPPVLLSMFFDVESTRFSARFRRELSFLFKVISAICLAIYLYLLIMHIKNVFEGSLFEIPWPSIAVNMYALIILVLVNSLDIAKKLKEYLQDAHPYFFSMYRNTLSLTILSLLVQILILFIPDVIVLYFGLAALALIGLDQLTVVARMFIYHDDYFVGGKDKII